MELRIETHQTGNEILDDIKARWADRKAILRDDSPDARDALFWWDLLQDKARRQQRHVRGKTLVLEAEDLRLLTGTRLELLKHVAEHRGESLGLVSQHLGRDLANVKRDSDKLTEMGLLGAEKRGRRMCLYPAGNSIHIDLLA